MVMASMSRVVPGHLSRTLALNFVTWVFSSRLGVSYRYEHCLTSLFSFVQCSKLQISGILLPLLVYLAKDLGKGG